MLQTREPQKISRRGLLALFERGRPEAPDDFAIRVHRRAMACRFEILLDYQDAAQLAAAREALEDVERLEALLTVFCEDSECSRVNRLAHQEPVVVGAETFELLQLSEKLHRLCEGAFDVTSTPLSRCWGFLKREARLPTPEAIAAARACVGMDGVRLDEGQRTVRLERAFAEINFGSIGKGYALDQIGKRARTAGIEHALLSAAGSSALAIGGRQGGFPIDLRSRRARRGRLGRVVLRNAALATSGASEQYFEAGGKRYGHVIDPRTGWPAAGILSATVVATEAAVADALSTALLVGGLPLAERVCERRPETLAILTTDDEAQTTHVFGRHAGAAVTDLEAGNAHGS